MLLPKCLERGESSARVGDGVCEASEGRIGAEWATKGVRGEPLPAPAPLADPVLEDLAAANIGRAVVEGGLGAEWRLGQVIAEFLTKGQ
ncbi:MAG TPA: hypothetical protein VD994_03215 [Prosthecobacter sp.]|nr:hypothetical protein [Prosthecobacter sp.]